MTRSLAACMLAFAAGLALAQQQPTPAPAPAPSAEEPKRPPLNLRLDDAGRYARDPAPASGPTESLPSLGTGNTAPSRDLSRPSKDPIPKDTAPDKQM